MSSWWQTWRARLGAGTASAPWLREPLVHFLVAGALLFGFFAWRGGTEDPADRTIIISAERVEQLAANWSLVWQRQPGPAEIEGLIRNDIKEEIYYREGLRLGLDRDDPLIRRRIRSKMEFLARAELDTVRPDDATLQAMIDRNPARYAQGARYSFDHIYIGAVDASAARVRADALRAALDRGSDWAGLGEALALPRHYDRADARTIERDFGPAFAQGVAGLKAGTWQGPIESGYGLHLVRVTAIEPGRPPQLSQIRQQVENDWRAATATAREARAYQALLDSYDIRIARP